MFGKKEKSKRPKRPAGSLAQVLSLNIFNLIFHSVKFLLKTVFFQKYGIFEVPEGFDNMGKNFMDDDDDDDDLEAELAALTASDDNRCKPTRSGKEMPLVHLHLILYNI